MCGINAVGAQGCSCMSTFCHAPLKIALLLHKMANGPYSLSETVQQSYIPLLKALMCGINAVGAQGSGCMFTLCHAPLKMAVLLHKTEKVWDSFSETVSSNLIDNIQYMFLQMTLVIVVEAE